MSKNVNYLLFLPVALFVASLAACNPGNNADTTAGTDRLSEADSGKAQISITNPMPHEMIVSADWGQGQKELGSLKPNETKTFDISASQGTKVELVASDQGRTHSPKGSVTLESGQAATWTIQ
ncbi:MAG: hypothetical protein ABIT92_02435 [Gammaproteobacteria bacterium]